MFIYKITNLVNGKIYIGQTTKSIEHRWKYHCYKNSGCKILANSIAKYGKDNFKIEEIYCAFTKQELDKKEIYFIQYYNSLKPNGYNIQTGGGINDSMRGRKHTEESIEKMSIKASGKNNSQFGKKGMLCPSYDKKQSKEHIEKVASKHRKKVLCVELNKIYMSLKDAANDFKTYPACISAAIYNKNRVKRYKGFTFKYIEE